MLIKREKKNLVYSSNLKRILFHEWTKKALHAIYETGQVKETLDDDVHVACVSEVH